MWNKVWSSQAATTPRRACFALSRRKETKSTTGYAWGIRPATCLRNLLPRDDITRFPDLQTCFRGSKAQHAEELTFVFSSNIFSFSYCVAWQGCLSAAFRSFSSNTFKLWMRICAHVYESVCMNGYVFTHMGTCVCMCRCAFILKK